MRCPMLWNCMLSFIVRLMACIGPVPIKTPTGCSGHWKGSKTFGRNGITCLTLRVASASSFILKWYRSMRCVLHLTDKPFLPHSALTTILWANQKKSHEVTVKNKMLFFSSRKVKTRCCKRNWRREWLCTDNNKFPLTFRQGSIQQEEQLYYHANRGSHIYVTLTTATSHLRQMSFRIGGEDGVRKRVAHYGSY